MNNLIYRLAAGVLAGMVIASLLSGCSSSAQSTSSAAEEATDTAVIAVQGDGMPMVTDASNLVGNISVAYGGSAGLIIADGSPTLLGPVRFEEKKNNEIQQQRQDAQYRADIIAAVQAAKAAVPETDLVTAITLAGRMVNSGTAGRKNIVICHSGITTAPSLPMQELDLLNTDPVQLVDQMEEAAMIPQLSGVEVDFYGLGDTAGSQSTPAPQQVQWLEHFWQAFFDRAGAQLCFHTDVISGEANTAGGHTVTPLPVTGGLTFTAVTSEQVAFRPDSTAFVDESAARAALGIIAQQIKGTAVQYVIAGSTADVDGSTLESSQELSLARAQAVRQILCEQGVPSQQLCCIGLGNQPTSRRSAEQAQNRCVYIVASTEPEAVEFLSAGLAE